MVELGWLVLTLLLGSSLCSCWFLDFFASRVLLLSTGLVPSRRCMFVSM